MSEIGDIIRKELDRAVSDIRRNAQSAGKVATGKTIRSLEREVFDFGGGAEGRIYGASYISTLETGRPPARNASTPYQKQQFIRSLMEWCRVRGIGQSLNDEQLYRLANYMRWRINTFGSQLWQRGGRKDIITPALEQAEARIEGQLEEYIIEYTYRKFNNKQ